MGMQQSQSIIFSCLFFLNHVFESICWSTFREVAQTNDSKNPTKSLKKEHNHTKNPTNNHLCALVAMSKKWVQSLFVFVSQSRKMIFITFVLFFPSRKGEFQSLNCSFFSPRGTLISIVFAMFLWRRKNISITCFWITLQKNESQSDSIKWFERWQNTHKQKRAQPLNKHKNIKHIQNISKTPQKHENAQTQNTHKTPLSEKHKNTHTDTKKHN